MNAHRMHRPTRSTFGFVVLALLAACASERGVDDTHSAIDDGPRARSIASLDAIEFESPMVAYATVRQEPQRAVWHLEYSAGTAREERISITIPSAETFPRGDLDIATHRVETDSDPQARISVQWLTAATTGSRPEEVRWRAFSAVGGTVVVEPAGPGRVAIRLDRVRMLADDESGAEHVLDAAIDSQLVWRCEVPPSAALPAPLPRDANGAPMLPSGQEAPPLQYVMDVERTTAFCKEQIDG